ncbi:unnamed protein product [Penicillium salamii]|nr:unnamed protein product [Penicillium salamii]CAG8278357.1 unnamed protein product [Penicillium salamii]
MHFCILEMSKPVKTYDDYKIAWICALPVEAAAAIAMLDTTHPSLAPSISDRNTYTLGEIGSQNIVVVCLPSGVYGTTSAAIVTAEIRSTFPAIELGLLVGVGGGVPSAMHDIRLGDVVVSKPIAGTPGVIQYDFGKVGPGGRFQQTGVLHPPPQRILSILSRFEAEDMMGMNEPLVAVIKHVYQRHPEMKDRFAHPGWETDRLYDAAYDHPTDRECDPQRRITRVKRCPDTPRVHYGLVASGNQVIKNAKTRDKLRIEHPILCFEMEAAGLMNQLPSLVIRGICDYADTHKDKDWQSYAALTAAAYAKILVSKLPKVPQQTTGNFCFVVPFERNIRFLGREDEVSKIERMILTANSHRKAAISGLGGVGKTQIALELAYRLRNRPGSSYSVFWITATSAEAVEQALMEISEQLNLTQSTSATDAKTRVKQHLSQKSAGHWLLVIDNADDMELWWRSSVSLKTFLPASEYGFTLLTTRNHQLATKLAGPDVIKISQMEENMAITLLEHALIQTELMQDDMSATCLVNRLDGLPLAIIQAASYINENSLSLETYISLLDDHELGKVELLSQDFDDEWRYIGTESAVATTWLISFAEIEKLSALAAEYLSFISCLDLQEVPLSLLPSGESRVKQHNSLGILKAYSFVTERTSSRSIIIHRLVHLATRHWLRRNDTLTYWTRKSGQRLREVFPPSKHEHRALWRSYLPHAQYILQSKILQKLDWEELAQKVAHCLYSDSRYQEAEILFREVLQEKRQRLNTEDPQIISCTEWIAGTLWAQGRLSEAEEMQVNIIEVRNRLLGPENPQVLSSIGNLASTYMNQGRWSQAEELEKSLLDRFNASQGPKHPQTLTAKSNLASTHRSQGRWKMAEELELEVLAQRRILLGLTHPDTITSMNNLASTYISLGRWGRAEELQMQLLDIMKPMGPEHSDYLSMMGNLASTFRHQGRWKEAEDLEVQAMKQFKLFLGIEHPNTLTSMANLASTYRGQKRWLEALELEIETTKALKSVLGQQHPITLRSMGNLASTNRCLGRLQDARMLEEEVMNNFRSTLGLDHPDTLTSMANLACTYRYESRLLQAEELELQVFEKRKAILTPKHPDSLSSMWNLSRTWKKQGRDNDAVELLRDCIELYNQELGRAHPDTIEATAEFDAWVPERAC